MATELEQKDIVKINQYITDKKGHKVAAIIDINELNRVMEALEDYSELKNH